MSNCSGPERRRDRVGDVAARGIAAGDRAVLLGMAPVLQPHRPVRAGKRVQSPAAKIAGSEVRQWSSTMMPSCVARPAAFASRSSGATPVPTTMRSAAIGVAGLGVDRKPSVRQSRAARSTAVRDADIDAARAVALVDERGGLRVADARQDARRDLDDGGLDAELGGRGGDFEPDQPAADDQQRLGSGARCALSARASASVRR